MKRNFNMSGLKDVRITKIGEWEEQVVLHVELPIANHSCPYCGEKTKKVHDYRIQKIKHLKWFERMTILMYRKRRYECVHCHKRFYEKNSLVDCYQRFSRKWNQMVSVLSVKGKIFKKVAKLLGTTSPTVMRRFNQLANKTFMKKSKKQRLQSF